MNIRKTLLVVLILGVISALAIPSALTAGNGMLPVKGGGMSYLLPPDEDPYTPDAIGQAQLIIGGQTYNLQVALFLTAPPKQSGNTMHLKTTHVFTGDGISLITADKEVLVATKTPGLYLLNVNSDVVGGGAGHLSFHGTLSFATGEVLYEARGAVNID